MASFAALVFGEMRVNLPAAFRIIDDEGRPISRHNISAASSVIRDTEKDLPRKSFADDFNGNGKTEVEVYYIDYDSKEDYANYANGSDTKLTTEMQIADAVMVISDHDFSGMVVPDEVFVDLSSLFPDNEHIDKQFFYLKDTDFADRVGVDRSKIKDDTFIAVRAPKRVMYASKDEMQETYNKDMPVIEKIIDDLSK